MSNVRSTSNVETKDDNIYYNIQVYNGDSKLQPVQLVQQLTNTIVDNPEDYYLSCVRFQLDGGEMPIFIFKDNGLNTTNPLYESNYWVSLEYNGFVASATLKLPPYVFNIYTSVPPKEIFSYQHFITLINQAYADAFTALGLLTTLPAGSVAPYMVYNTTNLSFSINAQAAFYDINLGTPIYVWMNTVLYKFFDNFWMDYYGQGNASHLDYRFKIQNLYDTNTFTRDSPVANTVYIKWNSEYPSTFRWWDQQVISFKSQSMGIRNEYITGVNYSNVNLTSNQTAGVGIPSTSQFTDFVPAISSGDAAGWRSTLIYYPTSQYRLLDLLGNQVNKIDLTIVWKDKQGVEYPIFLSPEQSCSIKLLFVKKSLYKNFKESGLRIIN